MKNPGTQKAYHRLKNIDYQPIFPNYLTGFYLQDDIFRRKIELSAARLNFCPQDETFSRKMKLSLAICSFHAQNAVFACFGFV